MPGCTIGFKDVQGTDLGYKFVAKDTTYNEFQKSGQVPASGGTLWAWGWRNSYGELGRNYSSCLCCNIPSSYILSPAQTVAGGNNWRDVKSTNMYANPTAAATKTDGTLWMWGNNSWGIIGDNTVIHKSSPVQTVAGGTNWKLVCGGSNSFAAVKTDGTLWSWGFNSCGVLGISAFCTNCGRSSPVQTASGGTNWSKVSISREFATAVKTDGSLWIWGRCNTGSPTQITGSTAATWRDVAANACKIIAIKDDNTLWERPITGTTMTENPAGGTDWKTMQGNSGSVFGFSITKKDGTLWAWGGRTSETLTPGDSANYSGENFGCCFPTCAPILNITGCGSWRCAVNRITQGFGIKTDGTLWTWGSTGGFDPYLAGKPFSCDYSFGEIVPIKQVLPKYSDWKSVAISVNAVFAIREG